MENKIFILEPIEKNKDNPWNPWYDKCFGYIIEAPNEDKAREIAHENAGDENRGEFLGEGISNTTKPWLDPIYSTCKELKPSGNTDVVMMDFRSA